MESHAAVAVTASASVRPSFFTRHLFAIKRVFSLLGLFFGGYVVVHLITNASLLAGVATFQDNVARIHSLGPALPIVEWTFLFIPISFHALVGCAILAGAIPNLGVYRYAGNLRYTLQRVTAIILLLLIPLHIVHMHHYGKPFGGGMFQPEHAASSLGAAMQSALWIQLAYALGVISAAFHLGNGLWTAGITWGIWTTPEAQKRANYLAVGLAVFVTLAGIGAIIAARRVDVGKAIQIEDRIDTERLRLRGEEIESGPAALGETKN